MEGAVEECVYAAGEVLVGSALGGGEPLVGTAVGQEVIAGERVGVLSRAVEPFGNAGPCHRAFGIEEEAGAADPFRCGLREVVDVGGPQQIGEAFGAVAEDFHFRGVGESPRAQGALGDAVHPARSDRNFHPVARSEPRFRGIERGVECVDATEACTKGGHDERQNPCVSD